jgi:hypothetical protein
MKLTGRCLDRASRWRKTPLIAGFRSRGEWNWCLANVARAACDACGLAMGTQWMAESGSPNRLWVCDACRTRGVTPAVRT